MGLERSGGTGLEGSHRAKRLAARGAPLPSLCFHHTRAQVGASPGLELSVNLELSLDLVHSKDWGSAQG